MPHKPKRVLNSRNVRGLCSQVLFIIYSVNSLDCNLIKHSVQKACHFPDYAGTYDKDQLPYSMLKSQLHQV